MATSGAVVLVGHPRQPPSLPPEAVHAVAEPALACLCAAVWHPRRLA